MNLIVEHLSEILLASFFFLIVLSMVFFMYNPEYRQQNLIASDLTDTLNLMKPGSEVTINLPFEAEIKKINNEGFEVLVGDLEPKFIKFNLINFEFEQTNLTVKIKYNTN